MRHREAGARREPANKPATEFVHGGQLWETIQALSRSCRGPKRVASAYIGNGAGKKIGLGAGDRLLVALSTANVKNGTVSPHELRRLKGLGVEVFLEATLHAKVYHFGDVAVVGSANLSTSSGSLHEAAMVTRDAGQLVQIDAWFDQTCTTPVTDAHLDQLEPHFEPRKGGAGSSDGRHDHPRLWLVWVTQGDFPEEESDECNDGARRAATKLSRESAVESLHVTERTRFSREAKVDDLIIQVFKQGRSVGVYPHTVVLDTHRIGRSLYIHVQEHERPANSWAEFRKDMRKLGLELENEFETKLVTDSAQIARAKQLTVPPIGNVRNET